MSKTKQPGEMIMHQHKHTLDFAKNAQTISEYFNRHPPCKQCGNPYPGALIEGICHDCQMENAQRPNNEKRDPYAEAHGLD